MRTVVVAMDKFKGSATAEQVCASVCQGVADASFEWTCHQVPLADGGDGTVAALVRAGWMARPISTIDAQGMPVTTDVATHQSTVVLELAGICGIERWQGELQPWLAHTTGLGIAIRQQIEAGERDIVIAVGGSASTDGGLGVLTGLGFRITDESGSEVPRGLRGLRSAVNIEFPDDIALLRSCEWTVLVDVDAPLCGSEGAARRFGPQKGLSHDEVLEADALLDEWDDLLARVSGRRVGRIAGVGAAGGVAAPLAAMFDAHLESGFDYVAGQIHLERYLAAADLIITGEGRVDASSLTGKVVGEVLSMAARGDVPTVVVAGSIADDVRDGLGGSVICLVDMAGGVKRSMTDTTGYLRRAGRLIAEGNY